MKTVLLIEGPIRKRIQELVLVISSRKSCNKRRKTKVTLKRFKPLLANRAKILLDVSKKKMKLKKKQRKKSRLLTLNRTP